VRKRDGKETAESFTYDAEREGQGGYYRLALASSVYFFIFFFFDMSTQG
jgi:hypothetical protein